MLKINIDRHVDSNIRFYFTGDIEPFSRNCLYICQSAFFSIYSSSFPELDTHARALYVFGRNDDRDQEEINTDIKTFIKVNTTIQLFNKYSESVQNAM